MVEVRRSSNRTRSTTPGPLTDFERLGDAVHLIRLGARAGLVTQNRDRQGHREPFAP